MEILMGIVFVLILSPTLCINRYHLYELKLNYFRAVYAIMLDV